MTILNSFLKPSGKKAKWLLFIGFITLIYVAKSGHLAILINYLNSDNLTFKIGTKTEISAYKIIKAIIIIIGILWITSIISEFGENQIKTLMKKSRASSKALMTKAFQAIVYLLSLLIILNTIGVDITTLAVFSGALGIGLGFGLQKIASNFISGLILLYEKSVEVGDLIELNDGISGFVKNTGARYTLLETFESREIMIPNEDFITNRVTNWTFSNERGRVEIKVGVAYGTDLKLASKLILQAAKKHPRCSKEISPECYLINFGDSSIDFELYFWVDDIIGGRKKPRSEVMFEIWEAFRENNIQIPFPQRDVHLKKEA